MSALPQSVDSDYDGTFQVALTAGIEIGVEALRAAAAASDAAGQVWALTEGIERLLRLLRLAEIVWLNEQHALEAVRS